MIRTVLRDVVLVVYLLATGTGVWVAMTHMPPPILWHLAYNNYVMVAPYQGYDPDSMEILAEGRKPDGSWERIDVRRYFPVSQGEFNVRFFLFNTRVFLGEAELDDKYKRMAITLLQHEAERGRHYEAVRLGWQYWPNSPLGYHALQNGPEARYEPVIVYPS